MDKKLQAEILVVDDHHLILEGVCNIVSNMPGVIVTDAVTTGKLACELIEKRDYDIYILDVSIPDISGFDLIKKIRELNEHAMIIVYTMHEEVWVVNRLVQSSVNAIVLKSSSTTELMNAVQSVLLGESYTCSRFSFILKKLHRSSVVLQLKDAPTKRELDVLQAVAKGMNTHEIAILLNISENTVETFRKRLISKFEAKNAIDMVLKAVALGLVRVE